MTPPVHWETRVHQTVVISQWVAVTVGIVSSMVASGGSGSALVAMGLAGVYVIATTLTRQSLFYLRFGAEAFALTGAVVVLVALTLTGGSESPYLLLSMGPPVLATVYGGFRSGVTTAAFAAALLVLVTLAQGASIIDSAPAVALYFFFVLLVGVIRRLLEDINQHASALAQEKETATQRLQRLEEIHNALIRLSEDLSTGRLNAIEVAADTLDTILERFPGAAGRLAIDGEEGRVVLAARGIPDPEGHLYHLPLSTRDQEVGGLELTTAERMTPSQLTEVAAIIHPVSVAFANLQLLQDIVGSAVTEERTRLARELHDEIGPALASLGLALDMTAMQQADRPEVAADLQVLRSNVTKLVEDVRAAVADLRSSQGPTLTARILRSISDLSGEEPPIIVDIEERRPPRAAQISDLTSIIAEAARNAHRHSNASKILISGQVDRSYGSCSVVDDGVGFDPAEEPEGHFGLTGMRERAQKIGATIKFDSKPGSGTVVTVEWGSR